MLKYIRKSILDLPPSWLALFLVITWLQVRWFNPFGYDTPLINYVGWGLIGLGVALMFWALMQFLALKTTVVPRNIPSAFIAKGPYRFSRNPIYLADTLVLLGFVLLVGSALGVVLVPVFMALIYHRFIKGEEAGLQAAFPEEYRAFAARTRRWL